MMRVSLRAIIRPVGQLFSRRSFQIRHKSRASISDSKAPEAMVTISRQYQPSQFDNVEDVESYKPGGFHPIHLGDSFQNKYEVLHKLGYGGFSTVWLAKDTSHGRYVALKVIQAQASTKCTELQILQHLGKGSPDHPGRAHVSSLLDHFTIEGPNGKHICLVSQVAGPSIAALNDCPGQVAGSRRLRADIARKVGKQAVEALQFIHSQGICHGDFTASNILFKISKTDELSKEEIFQCFGRPKTENVLTRSGSKPGKSAPRYLVESAPLPDAKYLAEDILVVDFGQAFFVDRPPSKEDIGIPFSYCAPEVIFDSKVGIYSDIWALGCVLFEIRAGQQLFSGWTGDEDEILRQMVQTYGRLPDPWWKEWKNRGDYFEEDGKPRKSWDGGTAKAIEYPLSDMLADIGTEDEASDADNAGRQYEEILEPNGARLSGEEAFNIKELLDGIFEWKPEKRMAVAEILGHPWLKM